jgi:hypothetical protein
MATKKLGTRLDPYTLRWSSRYLRDLGNAFQEQFILEGYSCDRGKSEMLLTHARVLNSRAAATSRLKSKPKKRPK